MRPGQAAPEFLRNPELDLHSTASFNEAGAGCPGIPALDMPVSMKPSSGFNEAGAGCPGIPAANKCRCNRWRGFNEAGAGCPGIHGRP